MPRNFNTLTASPAENDADTSLQFEESPVDFGDDYELADDSYEDSPENPETAAEQNVEDATERVSDMLAGEGSAALDAMKDKFGENYEAFKENAKSRVKKIGSSIAKFTKKAGLVTVGAGVIAGRKYNNAMDSAAEKIDSAQATAQERYEGAKESVTETWVNTKQSVQERYTSAKETIAQRRQERQINKAHGEALKENERRDRYDQEVADIMERDAERKRQAEEAAREAVYNEAFENGQENAEQHFETVETGNAEQFNYNPEEEGGYLDGWEATRQALLDRAHEEALAENEDFDEATRQEIERQKLEEISREYAEYKMYRAQRRAELRQQAYDKAKNTYVNASDRVLNTRDDAVARAGELRDAAAERITELRETAKERAQKIGKSIATFARNGVKKARAAREFARTTAEAAKNATQAGKEAFTNTYAASQETAE